MFTFVRTVLDWALWAAVGTDADGVGDALQCVAVGRYEDIEWD